MFRKLILITIVLLGLQIQAQNISLMTYNIRLDVASDGENAWDNRKDFLKNQVTFYAPDFMGTQEGLSHQIKFLDDNLKGYTFTGQGREGGNKGEYSALFYNTSKFKVLKEGTFWLSETPDKVSKGWDAAYLRVCTYGIFKDKKSRKKVLVVNTHLDNQSETARNNGMDLILKKIDEINVKNYPVILMGDFNATPDSTLITHLKTKMTDTQDVSLEKPFGSYATFNGFKFCEPATLHIDYIFISNSNKIKVLKHAVLTDSDNMKYPSDHFPVFTKLQLK